MSNKKANIGNIIDGLDMNFEVGEGVNESDDARVAGNRELDAVSVKASWCVGVGKQHNLPRTRKLIVGGDKETDESAEGAKARTS